jgi:sortase A
VSDSPRRPNERRTLGETLRWMHRTGPTRRWARWYRHHWRRLRAARDARWDRPPEPHDWRWAVGLLGRTLIVTGLLMLGFVGYQLWGTGIETARAQRDLASRFDEVLADRGPIPTTAETTAPPTTTADTSEGTVTTTEPEAGGEPADEIEPISLGDPVARLEMPSIGTDHIVVAGVGVPELQLGPGHFPDTPLPGQLGNAAIAGHRTTYGQPFHDVDRLAAGDDIVVTTSAGTFVYEVTDTLIVDPSAYHVVSTTDPTKAMLTLTSCHPKWSAAQRIIIHAELDPARSDPVGEPTRYANLLAGTPIGLPTEDVEATTTTTTTTTVPTTAPTDDLDEAAAPPSTTPPTTTVPVSTDGQSGISDAFSAGWFHDTAAIPHVAGWGALLIALWGGARLLARRRRSLLVGWGVAIVPFVASLYFFYENVNRLLPPNL